jgi:hypothetical protein
MPNIAIHKSLHRAEQQYPTNRAFPEDNRVYVARTKKLFLHTASEMAFVHGNSYQNVLAYPDNRLSEQVEGS